LYEYETSGRGSDLGLKVNYHPDRILEAAGPYENYYQLEKAESVWEYSGLDFERKSPPEKIEIKKFNSEENGAKYFFIKRLNRNYFYKYIVNNSLGYEITSIKDFEKKLNLLELLKSFIALIRKNHNHY
jgi:hypothetical protein